MVFVKSLQLLYRGVLVAAEHGTPGLHLRHVDGALVAETNWGAEVEPEGGAAGPGGEGVTGGGAVEADLGADCGQGEVTVEEEHQPGRHQGGHQGNPEP